MVLLVTLVYRHVNKSTGSVDYVGQSENIRKQEHVYSNFINTDTHNIEYSVAKSGSSIDNLYSTAKEHVPRYNPSRNRTQGGNGRR